MRMSEKCRDNNNTDNPLTYRRTDGGEKKHSNTPSSTRLHLFLYR